MKMLMDLSGIQQAHGKLDNYSREEKHLKPSQVEDFLNGRIAKKEFSNAFVIESFGKYTGDVRRALI
jgi:hypothetical protein